MQHAYDDATRLHGANHESAQKLEDEMGKGNTMRVNKMVDNGDCLFEREYLE